MLWNNYSSINQNNFEKYIYLFLIDFFQFVHFLFFVKVFWNKLLCSPGICTRFFSIFRLVLGKWVRTQTQTHNQSLFSGTNPDSNLKIDFETRKSIMILGFIMGLNPNFRVSKSIFMFESGFVPENSDWLWVWVWVRTHLPNTNLKIEKNRVHIPAFFFWPYKAVFIKS